MESRRTLKGAATSDTFLTTKHKKINNNTWETYIIHYMYLFAKRLFFYYLWVVYTALNLRFRENRKKNQRKTIVNSWVRCLENNQVVITSGFPTVNFRK